MWVCAPHVAGHEFVRRHPRRASQRATLRVAAFFDFVVDEVDRCGPSSPGDRSIRALFACDLTKVKPPPCGRV